MCTNVVWCDLVERGTDATLELYPDNSYTPLDIAVGMQAVEVAAERCRDRVSVIAGPSSAAAQPLRAAAVRAFCPLTHTLTDAGRRVFTAEGHAACLSGRLDSYAQN